MSGGEPEPLKLRQFDKAKARRLYASAAISGGAFLVLLAVMSEFHDAIRSPVIVNLILGTLVLCLIAFAYSLPRSIRVARREIRRSHDGNPL